MRDTHSQEDNRKSIIWVLPGDHIIPPDEILSLDVKLCITQSPSVNRNTVLSALIKWDRRRANCVLAGHATTNIDHLSGEHPSTGKDEMIIVSGNREAAEQMAQQIRSMVYWLAIDGYGATDPQAVWAEWLNGAETVQIRLYSIRDRAHQMCIGECELRVHRSSPALTQMALLRASALLIEQRIHNSMDSQSDSLLRINEHPIHAHAQKRSSIYSCLRVSFLIAIRTLFNQLTQSNKRNDQWAIGIGNNRNNDDRHEIPIRPRVQDVYWVKPSRDRFIADPFLLRIGENIVLFFEELFYTDWKGRLKAMMLDIDGRPNGKEITILERPYHLSFPFVFEDSAEPDSLFLLPEQMGSGHTVLYRSKKETDIADLRFDEDTTLLGDYPGIDPIILKWNGYYYLFVTNGAYGNYDNNLQLFFSESLRGPYTAHPKNPIRAGLRGSRMAGPIMIRGNMLYRPGQDCVARYGAGIILYQINYLSPSDYQESEDSEIYPDPSSQYGIGCHTLSWCDGLAAIDGLREVAIPEIKTKA